MISLKTYYVYIYIGSKWQTTKIKKTYRRHKLANKLKPNHLGDLVPWSTLKPKLKSDQTGLNGAKQGQTGPNGAKWGQMVPNGAKQGQTGPNGVKRGQKVSYGAKCGQKGKIGPNKAKWGHTRIFLWNKKIMFSNPTP